MKIYKGKVGWKDSFQELADCWQKKGYCDVEQSNDEFSWAESSKHEGLVMLHEYDKVSSKMYSFDFGARLYLFANEQHPIGSPWIYWPRHIKNVENLLKEKPQDKDIESIFIGAAENPVQYINRTKYDWKLAVEHFDFKVAIFEKDYHRYSNVDFLKLISRAKFGLSLEGYGPKCQRDIEYMAFGVVPVFTWKTFNDYYEPLVEGKHYLFADTPKEAKEKIKSTSQKRWKEMSENCKSWFGRNCSIKGSFEVTAKLIS